MLKYILAFCFFAFYQISGFGQEFNGKACSTTKIRAFQNSRAQARLAFPGDANIDAVFHRIKLNINPNNRFLIGSVFTTFIAKADISNVSFDLQTNMKVDSVIIEHKKVSHAQASNKLSIILPKALKTNEVQSLEIFYRGTPRTSAFGSFSIATHGNAKSPVVWTLSEPYGAQDWWPCKDDPSDKIDSTEVWITLPASFVSVSNGVQSGILNHPDGTKTYQWKSSHPIAHYLISIACSNYQLYQNTFINNGKSMPVEHYVYPEILTTAVKNQLDQTVDMLKFFTDLFGEYPFIDEKYGHAMCNFGGGMEHQTVSSMGGFSEDLIAHELAHQWFGDKITCKTWSDIFVNEAFASYAEALFQEHKYGKEAYMETINDHVSRAKKTTGPIFISNPLDENLIFNYGLTYGKGAVVLHMLRGVLGDSLFFKSLKNYQQSEFAYKAASIQDFRIIAEKTSKQELKYFFDEWTSGLSYPRYTFDYAQTQADRLKINVSQQKLNTSPTFFKMPIQFKIILESGKEITQTFFQNEITQSFEVLNLKESVKNVIFDPNNLIMKDLTNLGGITSNEIQAETFHIFPNPATDFIEIKHPLNSLKSMEILNSNGQKVKVISPNTTKVDIRNLKTGTYFLNLIGENQSKTLTFIKY
ncbi:T9SS C-terminal target domain-containing protein [Lacihabitans sp. CCS-44]|uniref:M1 family aminopeptidase n=1 Tax=Lacihabitans sp. CCS-44 TaxID=2487331 RepID=UPI0020CDD57A|nr:M1 family aminopeptidase [Lacihabitans sp. CCS-44]MCP9753770.1 T9SS C-terminal target domain-containing protein [Lacihabitans sp. CCS-44]